LFQGKPSFGHKVTKVSPRPTKYARNSSSVDSAK
jgi:hypothetical protein